MMIAITPRMMVVDTLLVIESKLTGVAVAVVAAGITVSFVTELDGQYELVPAKVALIVYTPVVSGTKLKPYVPDESVVVVPILTVLPLGSTAVKVTVTPSGCGGLFSSVEFCICL